MLFDLLLSLAMVGLLMGSQLCFRYFLVYNLFLNAKENTRIYIKPIKRAANQNVKAIQNVLDINSLGRTNLHA